MVYGYKDEKNRYVSAKPEAVARSPKVTASKKLRKKVLAVPFLLIICLFVGCATWAIINVVTPTVTNPFSMGETVITIPENFDGWNTKQVRLKNETTGVENPTDGIVRAMLVPVIKDADGNDGRPGATGTVAAPTGNTIVMGDFTFDLAADWSTNWFYQDGYFYYKKVLAPGEQTTMLLTKVRLTTETDAMKRKYQGYDIQVNVLADILQASDAAARDAWSVKVTGNTVAPL